MNCAIAKRNEEKYISVLTFLFYKYSIDIFSFLTLQ